MLKFNTTIILWTPIYLSRFVVRCGSKTWYQKDMCLEENQLCAHHMLTILSSIVNMIGRIYMATQ